MVVLFGLFVLVPISVLAFFSSLFMAAIPDLERHAMWARLAWVSGVSILVSVALLAFFAWAFLGGN
jgi:hypothetical protein